MTDDPKNPTRGKTKADLTKVVYKLHGGLTQYEAAQVVDTILQTVKTSLLEGRQVKITNFGVFEVKERRGRTGVDPSSGEPIFIPEHKGLSFRPAHKLKQLVEGTDGEDS